MAAFGGYTHFNLPHCTPRQLIALLQQARRVRRRHYRLTAAAVARGYLLRFHTNPGEELARLSAE